MDAAEPDSNAGMQLNESDLGAQSAGPGNGDRGSAEQADKESPQASDIEEDIVNGSAQAPRRKPKDPVPPNRRRSHVKEKMKVLKRKFRDLKSACGDMAAYAVIFAAEASSHGRHSGDTVVFASDDCLLTRLGFDLRGTGPEPGYHIGAGIYDALAKEKDMQSARTLENLTPQHLRTLGALRKWLREAILQRLNHELDFQPGERPVTQAYADRRVQRPDWWPADCEWSAATVNNMERGRLDDLFIVMRDWRAATERESMEAEAARRRGLASTGARARQSGVPGEADIGTGDAGPHSDRDPGPSTVSSGQAFSARSHLTPVVEGSESGEAEPSAQGGSMHGNRHGGRQPARGRARGRRARVTATAGDQAADGRCPLQQRPAMGRTRRQAQSARTAGRTALRSPPLRRSVRNVSRKRQEALRPRPVQRKAPKARKQRKRFKRIAQSPGLSDLNALAQDGLEGRVTASNGDARRDAMPGAAALPSQQEEDAALLAPIFETRTITTRSARPALQQAAFVSTTASVAAPRRTRGKAPVPAPPLQRMQQFLHTLLADPAKESRVMGSNNRLLASGVAGEAIAESDIDVPSFIARYDQVNDVQAAQFLLGCQGAFTMSGQVQLRELLNMIVHTGNCSNL